MSTLAKDPDPRLVGAKCRWCPFAKNGAPVRPVFGEGPSDAEGIIFAESPGREEAEKHRLLVGATGQEFNHTLLSAKLQRSKLFLINVIACQPVGPKSVANMTKATECCRPLVLHQIARFGSEPHILVMGGWAWFSATGEKIALKNGRGFLREWKLEDMIHANVVAINRMRKELDKRVNAQSKAAKSGGGEPSKKS